MITHRLRVAAILKEQLDSCAIIFNNTKDGRAARYRALQQHFDATRDYNENRYFWMSKLDYVYMLEC